MPTISSEILGVRHMGTICNTISSKSYIFSLKSNWLFFDKEASGESDSCFGNHCFMFSFLDHGICGFFGVHCCFCIVLSN